jgi:ketosteroid isomerase-like protein
VSANLDLVRSIYADWDRGDFGSFDWANPDLEFVGADGLELGTWTGRERVQEVTRDIVSDWEDYRQHPDEYRELDDERVLVVYRRSGRGKASGMDVTEVTETLGRGAAIFHIRDGKVTRIVAYLDARNAFADLGLAPEGDAA